jgi:hypothetical protein
MDTTLNEPRVFKVSEKISTKKVPGRSVAGGPGIILDISGYQAPNPYGLNQIKP